MKNAFLLFLLLWCWFAVSEMSYRDEVRTQKAKESEPEIYLSGKEPWYYIDGTVYLTNRNEEN